ncbi:hypothetical protein [Nocardia nova]|uniref:hypothetical protein n=1 Tax=Nocardia nova TaxID=37330 RepID=UPI0012E7393E|nr:hypothetical protein [Nocardia nova]
MTTASVPAAPTEFLIDGVISFLAALSPRDFALIVAQARPPLDPDPGGAAALDPGQAA